MVAASIGSNSWGAGQIYPYVKSAGVYKCPVEVQGYTADVTNPQEIGTITASGKGTANGTAATAQYATGGLPGNAAAMTPQVNADGSRTHTGGANYLVMNGHVKWLLPGRLSSGHDAPRLKTAQGSGCTATIPDVMDNGGGQGIATLTFSKL